MSQFLPGFLAVGVLMLGACEESEDVCGMGCGIPFLASAAFDAGSTAHSDH